MPIYDYECAKCEHHWEQFELIASRDEPCSKECPECDLTAVRRTVGSVQYNKLDDMTNSRKLPQDFKDRLRDLSNKPGVKGTSAEGKLKGYFS